MKTLIKGQNYDFSMVSDKTRFYIKATHLASLRYSFINNLNAVLSEFNIGVDDKKVSESQWIVSRKQSNSLFKKANQFLLNQGNRSHIERKLNEDRKCGEWENRKII